ncbi:universal stress protein [Streptomyces xanthii]|uniref:Universal stress protein n=1 Tax=Streptomyces xanthii TaxID=2768069 RepID=A0A7H1B2M6_9ACTN|nr:universal stress protein [Streptomyces xanthii]QNS02981.1 universal stress protein [Streptomyces xanthii]
MTAQVTVGLDGSPESVAAARWAAREAVLREVPLRLAHVVERKDEAPSEDDRLHAERIDALLRDEADRARREHPDLEVLTERLHGRPAAELTAAADEADLLVLGSRGLGTVHGFVSGSVALSVLGSARHPVVLVRARETERAAASRGIVVGVDIEHSCDPLLAFAFTEAARRNAPIRFLYSRPLPTFYGYGGVMDPKMGEKERIGALGSLDERLTPWLERFPDVEATAGAVEGPAGDRLEDSSQDAELVIVGHRPRKLPVGPRLGHVIHTVVHHSTAPVAVVPMP